MGLSSDIISQFIKVNSNNDKSNKETTAYGTIVEYGNEIYVRLDGSDLLTPISRTTDVKNDERVIVSIKNHSVVVIGNVTSPSARTDDVKELTKVVADKVSTEYLKANYALITSLDAANARIDTLESSYIEADKIVVANLEAAYLKADKAIISKLDAATAKIGKIEADYIKTDQLTATNARIDTIESDYVKTNQLTAVNGKIDNLKSEYIESDKAIIKDLATERGRIDNLSSKYANIDFANISELAMNNFYANSGLIQNVTVKDGTITGELVGVTISGDRIIGNTIIADKLVVKGENGLYYKLNVNSLGETTASSDPKYQNGLDGSVIIAKSITATKISVSDLVAFNATIGGFKITSNSIYSGVKESATNSTEGVYLDSNGQLSVGNSDTFFKYYIDTDGTRKLDISANSISFYAGSEKKNVEGAIGEISNNLSSNYYTKSGVNKKVTDAAKTATNYLNFSTEGLVVGDMTASTLGNNVLIDSDSVDIRNGATVLASYASNSIRIGLTSGTNKNLLINTDGLHLYEGSTYIAYFKPTEVRLGSKAGTNTNVKIATNAINFRSGNEVIATFAPTLIELGKAATSSTISFCNGIGKIYAEDSEHSGLFDRMVIDAKDMHLRGGGVLIDTSTQYVTTGQEFSESSYANWAVASHKKEGSGTGVGEATIGGLVVNKYNHNEARISAHTSEKDTSTYVVLAATAGSVFSDFAVKPSSTTIRAHNVASGKNNSITIEPELTTFSTEVRVKNDSTFSSIAPDMIVSDTFIARNLISTIGGGVSINGTLFTGDNHVLWTGGLTMDASQTVTLQESISDQANGIVLVFSAYDSGNVQNYQFTCHYIPKYMIDPTGKVLGYTTFLGGNTFRPFGAKYLYIGDTTIKGHKDNTSTGTASGITYNNNKFVLRYVVGV